MNKEKELELKVKMFCEIVKSRTNTTNNNGRFINEIAHNVNESFEILNK